MKSFHVIIFGIALIAASCSNDGCLDPAAINYDPNAESDDGSCVYLAENINLTVFNKLGTSGFAYGSEAVSQSGRKVKFTRAQIYLSNFTFTGTGGPYQLIDPHLLIEADVAEYALGYLPEDIYTSFSFTTGVDSASNYSDPATFPSTSALSSNNPNHMHWGWNTGYIFYVLEGLVDTSSNMNGDVNAPFIFHVGTDQFLVDRAFPADINSVGDGATIELQIDWLKLLDGITMTSADSTRITHTMGNPTLAELMVLNVEEAISLP